MSLIESEEANPEQQQRNAGATNPKIPASSTCTTTTSTSSSTTPDFTDLTHIASLDAPFLASFTRVRSLHASSPTTSFSTHVDFTFNLTLAAAQLRLAHNVPHFTLPTTNLVPPIPNRLSYLTWLKTLCTVPPTHAIDIGTGASLIYPLLSHTIFPTLDILGTDIDPASLTHASHLITINDCTRISVKQTDPTIPQITAALEPSVHPPPPPTPTITLLTNKQSKHLPRALDELTTRGRKVTHWSWWAFPTTLEGALEPSPKTSISLSTAASFLHSAPPIWKAVLLKITTLVNKSGANVLPRIDHGRVVYFIKFWETSWHTPMWLRTVTTSLRAAYVGVKGPVIDFVMCNPPFYGEGEVGGREDGRERTVMTKSESVTDGGELTFVSRMIADSLSHQHSITWYSAMVSKLSNLKTLAKSLKQYLSGGWIRTTEFRNGQVTRYGLAWSFGEYSTRFEVEEEVGVVERRLVEFFGSDERIEWWVKREQGRGSCEVLVEATFDFTVDGDAVAKARREVRGLFDRVEGEVGRSNRRWKRRRKQEEEAAGNGK